MGRLGIDSAAHRRVPSKYSGAEYGHGHRRLSGPNVDVVAPTAASTAIARVGLSRLPEANLIRAARWIDRSAGRWKL